MGEMIHPKVTATSTEAVNQPNVTSSSNSASSSGDTDVDSNINVHCGNKFSINNPPSLHQHKTKSGANKDTTTNLDTNMFSPPVKSKINSSIPAHIKTIISTPSTIDMNQSADTLELDININAKTNENGDGNHNDLGFGMSMDMDNVSSISSDRDSDFDRKDEDNRKNDTKGDNIMKKSCTKDPKFQNHVGGEVDKVEQVKVTDDHNLYMDETDDMRNYHLHQPRISAINNSQDDNDASHLPVNDDNHKTGFDLEWKLDKDSNDHQDQQYPLGLPSSSKHNDMDMSSDMSIDGKIATSKDPPLSPRAIQSQLRVYKQIVASLTEENNALRVKDVTQMIKIEDLEVRIKNHTNSVTVPQDVEKEKERDQQRVVRERTKVQEMQRDIDDKNDMISSILKKNSSLTEEYDECQVKIADLGQKVIQIERELHSVQLENETLQKLLRTNRDAVMNLSLSMENENSYSLDDSTHMNVNRSRLDTSANMNVNVSVRSDEGSCLSANHGAKDTSEMSSVEHHQLLMLQEPVIQSLKNELEVTKSREQDLRKQLTAIAMDQRGIDGGAGHGLGSTIANKDTIMEKLSESQQEAIIYLNREVSDLREKLEEERKKMASHLDNSKTHREKIEVLEYENKLAVEETIKNEKLLEVTRQDLSIKLGENACYRDEIVELEEKARRVDQLNQQLVETRRECEKLEALKVAAENKAAPTVGLVSVGTNTVTVPSLVSASQEFSHSLPPKHKRTSSEYSDMNMDDATLITVEIEGDHDGVEMDVFANARTLSDHRQFSVLKKALKAKYEKKQKDLEMILEDKEVEIRRLSSCLEDQQYLSQKQVEEIQDIEIRRISHEAEMNEELENLRMSYKQRSLELLALKEKMKMSHDEKSRSTGERAWRHLSDTLIDGVAASIEIFESMSFNNDEVERNQTREDVQTKGGPVRPGPSLRSAKSFG